jgi:hypothetical protein
MMRWYHMIGGLALVLLLTMTGLPGFSYAQGAGSLADFRDKSSYSAEDLAQALFTEPASPVRTRGVGPAKTLPSLPLPQPAVALNVLFAPNSDTLPAASYAEVDKLGMVLSWPQYTDYRIQLAGHTDNQGSERKNQALSQRRVISRNASTLHLSACKRLAMVRPSLLCRTIHPRDARRIVALKW